MREISIQEATAVVGGMEQVNITRHKTETAASMASLKGVVHNSGGNSAGGGAGGGGNVTPTVTCVETIVQFSQAATGPKIIEFGVKGIKIENVPKIENVTKTSVCTTIKAQTSR